jgi:hypothetical protein
MKYLFSFAMLTLIALQFGIGIPAQALNAASKHATDGSTPITLTIENKVFPALLYNTAPAKELMARLPVTVSLNRGPVDYCGGIAPIDYGADDVQTGYRRGDLAYWIPGQDFVIFTENKENASGAPDLVVLGQINADIKGIQGLGSTIEVTIALDR